MDDLISRQAAIDAINVKNVNKGIISALQSIIEELPSAQPEPCVDTIDALDESIKHFDDMAEECRRNANIEQNDYMDMRDDAAEYRQLSIWLNELKWLRERFQSQPDSKETSPTHKALDTISRKAAIDAINKAFERVFAWDGSGPLGDKVLENVPSAQPEIIRCKDCRYYQDNNDGYPHINCKWDANETPDADDFCSGAERRTDEADYRKE